MSRDTYVHSLVRQLNDLIDEVVRQPPLYDCDSLTIIFIKALIELFRVLRTIRLNTNCPAQTGQTPTQNTQVSTETRPQLQSGLLERLRAPNPFIPGILGCPYQIPLDLTIPVTTSIVGEGTQTLQAPRATYPLTYTQGYIPNLYQTEERYTGTSRTSSFHPYRRE